MKESDFMQELISVIVPVYKVEKYLYKCIDSIINQTYKNIEIILVDDGSPDNCGKICDEYAKKDERVKVIHKENGGLSDARNAGLNISKGKYIAFVDSDDYVSEQMLEVMHDKILEDGTDMIISSYHNVNENGDLLNEPIDIKEGVFTEKEILKQISWKQCGYYVVVWDKLYRKEIFDNIRFPVAKLHEDEFVLHKILQKCNKISCISMPLYYYVKHKESIMHNEYSIKRLDAIEAHIERIKYLLNLDISEAIEYSVETVLSVFLNGYMKLNLNYVDNKQRLTDLRNEFCKLYYQIIKKKLSSGVKIRLTLFHINYSLYVHIVKRYLKIRNNKN